jgi:hypothetical protein
MDILSIAATALAAVTTGALLVSIAIDLGRIRRPSRF